MKIRNAAKINLALDVTGKLPSGYHTVESVFQTVGIYDDTEAELIPGKGNISVTCLPGPSLQGEKFPSGSDNIAYKAARLFMENSDTDCGCEIRITKNIPSQAGLGGGSSDAAAVISLLNILTDSRFSVNDLENMGKQIGSDVPFFFTGGTAYVSGMGEKVRSVAPFTGKELVISKGRSAVSTAEAYKKIDALGDMIHPDIPALIGALNDQTGNECRFFGNIFEYVTDIDEIFRIKDIMLENGASVSLMTGSGSAVFGIFDDTERAENCRAALEKMGFFAKKCAAVAESFIF